MAGLRSRYLQSCREQQQAAQQLLQRSWTAIPWHANIVSASDIVHEMVPLEILLTKFAGNNSGTCICLPCSNKRSARRLYFLTSFLRRLHFADSPTEWKEVNGSSYVRTLINFVAPEVKLPVQTRAYPYRASNKRRSILVMAVIRVCQLTSLCRTTDFRTNVPRRAV